MNSLQEAGPLDAARRFLREGRMRAAAAALAAVDETALDTGRTVLLATLRVESRLATGDVEAAECAADGLEEAAEGRDASATLARLALGELAAAHGDHTTAYDHFAAAADLPPVDAVRPWRSGAALALVRIGRRREGGALAREQIAVAEDARGRAFGLRALAVAETGQDPVGVLRRAREEAAQAADPRLTAQLVADLAGLLLLRPGSHDQTTATALLREAEEYAAAEELWPLHARVARLLTRAGQRPRPVEERALAALTNAERRVARLAATGMSNRQIAEHLAVSIKGVEWHLSRVYRKLGVGSRAGLASLLAS